jgi:hypothetical protein
MTVIVDPVCVTTLTESVMPDDRVLVMVVEQSAGSPDDTLEGDWMVNR